METFSPSSMSTTATTNNHHPTTHSSSQARPPAKRTSNTCVTCRARKVRCDGRRDVCANCERLGFSCSYDDGAGLNGEGLAGDGVSPFTLPRRRVRQACLNCHSRKARCSGTTPKCDRCRAQGIECVYRPGKRVRASVASTPGGLMVDTVMSEAPHVGGGRDDHFSDHSRSMSSGHPDHASATSPSNFGRETPGADDNNIEAVAMRTFDNFFRYVHHIPMLSFLHRASLMQRYHAGLIDRPLLLAMIGITALLSDLGPGTKELGPKCIDQAEALVLKEIERPSTLRLQALILIIKHRLLSTRFSSAFMLQAIASRFAVALRLNYENPKLCFLAQESRRRLMWSLYMLDTGLSGGLADFSLWAWRSDAIKIQLPCNERNFEYDLPETTEPLQQPAPGADGVLPPLPDDIGFLALHIRVHLLRNRILQYTKAVASRCTPAVLAKVPTRLAELSGELEAFSARLPVSFRWSDANVRLRTYSPRLCVFVMTHIWWQQCHCDLYRVALAGLREAMPSAAIDQLEMQHPGFAAHCRQKVYEHAREMADMFGLLLTLDNGVPVTDMDLPVCLYQCVRMLFYTLQHSSEGLFGVTTEGVVEMAKVCDKVLRQVVVTPITMNIREDMDKLLANGPLNNNVTASRPPTPSAVVMDTPGGHQRAASAQPPPAVLSRHSVLNKVIIEDDASANPGLPSPTPATDFPGGVQAFYQSLETPMPMPAMAPSSYGGFAPTATTATHHPDPATGMATGGVSKDGVLSNGTSASQQSNAFEGALEGLDMTLEPFGMESLTWFSNDWLNGDFPQADMSAV